VSQPKNFTIGDLSLRDCWKIVKVSFGCWLGLGAIYGFSTLVGWGYEVGSKSVFGVEPVSSMWAELPKWVKFGLIVIVALLFLRGFTSELIGTVGKGLIDLSTWLQKTSLKIRIFLVIGLTLSYVLLAFNWWVGFILIFFPLTLIGAYADLKREKIEQMGEEDM
jgi:hypothetical protein